MTTSSVGRFEALVGNGSDAIALVNAEGQILYATPSTTKVLGYKPQELVGRNGLDFFHPLDRGDFMWMLTGALTERRRPNQPQARVRERDGLWRCVESTAFNLLDEPRVGAIVFRYRGIDSGRL